MLQVFKKNSGGMEKAWFLRYVFIVHPAFIEKETWSKGRNQRGGLQNVSHRSH